MVRRAVHFELYDFAGDGSPPHAHNSVDLSDCGRLVVINARPAAADVPRMIRAAKSAPWDAVPLQADLLRSTDPDEVLEGANSLYQHFRAAGLGRTRTHKLLHLKRPEVFPIVDSVVRETYRRQAKEAGLARGSRQQHYWAALASELRADLGAYEALRQMLSAEQLGRLTVLRLADILVWSLHGRRRLDARIVARDSHEAPPGPTTSRRL